MRYLILIKNTKQVAHEFFSGSDKEAQQYARNYLKQFSLNYKKYTLLAVGV